MAHQPTTRRPPPESAKSPTQSAGGRITHHVHILEMNGESHRLAQSKRRRRSAGSPGEPWTSLGKQPHLSAPRPAAPCSNLTPPRRSKVLHFHGGELGAARRGGVVWPSSGGARGRRGGPRPSPAPPASLAVPPWRARRGSGRGRRGGRAAFPARPPRRGSHGPRGRRARPGPGRRPGRRRGLERAWRSRACL
jgi:hypothetical protein